MKIYKPQTGWVSINESSEAENWYDDPNGHEPIRPRLNEDPRAMDWEAKRRGERTDEAMIRGFRGMPPWVVKWIHQADILTTKGLGNDNTISVLDAVSQAAPPEDNAHSHISNDSYEYYEKVVHDIVLNHYRLFRTWYETE